jgi:general secretion pathway protein F
MKYFVVTVLSKGKRNEYGLYAEHKKEAYYLAKIKFSGIILKTKEASPPLEDQFKKIKESLFSNLKKRKLKQDSLIAAIRQLAVMANAGISIHDSLHEIADATLDKTLQLVLGTMAEDNNAGHSLSKSANKFS